MGSSPWSCSHVEVEDKVKGVRWQFRMPTDKDGTSPLPLAKGRRHAQVIKPTRDRMDESEDLMVRAQALVTWRTGHRP